MKKKISEKWKPIIDSLNLNETQKNWMEQYADNLSASNFGAGYYDISSGYTLNSDDFPNALPISMQIASKTIGLDLVSVQPMGGELVPGKSPTQKLKESRINKLRNLKGEEPNVVLPNDIMVPKGPEGHLFYMNYTYSGNTQNNI